VQIIFRGKETDAEAEYVDKFANPFPAAMRGIIIACIVSLVLSFHCM